ncbi:MAG: hypothetical protein IJS90_08215 [Clostridia bacterium]|nr:hypothetical protein [Clostridia bacterium]
MKKLISLILSAVLTFSAFGAAAYAADGIYYACANVTFDQTSARAMLELINDMRQSDEAWYWNETNTEKVVLKDLGMLAYDYELEKTAMLRAAEIAVSFSHTRPNGKRCFTAYEGTYYSAGENIAAGYRTYESVFIGWSERDDDYSGQGHRRNMLSDSFSAVGIGCAVVNGYRYWVQEFRYPLSNAAYTEPVDGTAQVTFPFSNNEVACGELVPETTQLKLELDPDNVTPLPEISCRVGGLTVSPAQVSASSDDESVVIIDDGNIITAGEGQTTVTVSAFGKSVSFGVTVAEHFWDEGTTIFAATCTEGEQVLYTCTVCSATRTETGAPLGHDFGEWTQTKAPECTEKGEEARYCPRCGETETRELEATGHTEELIPAVDATCTTAGATEGIKCSVCSTVLVPPETVEALGHNYASEVTAPSCTQGGYTIFICSRCNDSYTTDETAALGHDFGEWTQTKAPTCTEKGAEERSCSRCDESETREIAELGHDFGEWTQTKAPSCTEKGAEKRSCSRCDESETREIAELGHDFGEWTQTKAPTCTEKGAEERSCSRCDESETREIAELGHDFGQWTQTKAPTCTENGEEERSCSRCEGSEVRVIAALGHSFGEWETIKEATEDSPGTKQRECGVCKAVETEEIPFAGPDYVLGDADMDGEVTAADARIALRIAVKLESAKPGSKVFLACDTDKDGEITSSDARAILRCAVKLETLQ